MATITQQPGGDPNFDLSKVRSKDTRELLQRAREHGCTFQWGGTGHVRVFTPDGTQACSVGATVNGRGRRFKNIQRQIERALGHRLDETPPTTSKPEPLTLPPSRCVHCGDPTDGTLHSDGLAFCSAECVHNHHVSQSQREPEETPMPTTPAPTQRWAIPPKPDFSRAHSLDLMFDLFFGHYPPNVESWPTQMRDQFTRAVLPYDPEGAFSGMKNALVEEGTCYFWRRRGRKGGWFWSLDEDDVPTDGSVIVGKAVRDSVPAATPEETVGWLKAEDVAELLGCHINTAIAMGHRGEVEMRRVGRRYMFEPSSVEPHIPEPEPDDIEVVADMIAEGNLPDALTGDEDFDPTTGSSAHEGLPEGWVQVGDDWILDMTHSGLDDDEVMPRAVTVVGLSAETGLPFLTVDGKMWQVMAVRRL